jgi:hypothetical protein
VVDIDTLNRVGLSGHRWRKIKLLEEAAKASIAGIDLDLENPSQFLRIIVRHTENRNSISSHTEKKGTNLDLCM